MTTKAVFGALAGGGAGAAAGVVAHAPLGAVWGRLAGQLALVVGRVVGWGADRLGGGWSEPVALLSVAVACTVALWVVLPLAPRRPPPPASVAAGVALVVLGAPATGAAVVVAAVLCLLPATVRRVVGGLAAGTSLSLLWVSGWPMRPDGLPGPFAPQVLHLALVGLVVASALGAVRLLARDEGAA